MRKVYLSLIWILVFCSAFVLGQNRDRKTKNLPTNSPNNCRVFLNGKLLNKPQPNYPIEAKTNGISGKVEIAVEIDEAGNVSEIESANGNEILAKAASEAALNAKFSPTICDGKATKTVGIITFNFSPVALTKEFFKPAKIEDFTDVSSDADYYEAVLFLAENYRIAFGYADRKFHAEMPLTKGDFAHFLRRMLEMLDWRAKLANKSAQEIGLYQPYNPLEVKEIEFNPTSPYAESFKILSQKYNIVLANADGSFNGDDLMNLAEVIKIWQAIFGDDALPIHFLNIKENEKEMSRGEFAIYLKETLDVLTYKVLP